MEPAEARGRLWELLAGFMRTQAISVATRLGVPDVVADEPLDAAEIARRVGADELLPESVSGLLQALPV